MTLTCILATVFVDATCDLCGKPRLTYPDPETGGRVCLDCLEQLCEPLPELPPDPAICAMAETIISERRSKINVNMEGSKQ